MFLRTGISINIDVVPVSDIIQRQRVPSQNPNLKKIPEFSQLRTWYVTKFAFATLFSIFAQNHISWTIVHYCIWRMNLAYTNYFCISLQVWSNMVFTFHGIQVFIKRMKSTISCYY